MHVGERGGMYFFFQVRSVYVISPARIRNGLEMQEVMLFDLFIVQDHLHGLVVQMSAMYDGPIRGEYRSAPECRIEIDKFLNRFKCRFLEFWRRDVSRYPIYLQ